MLLHEFALEPDLLTTWDRFQLLTALFGIRKGRLVARFPTKWVRKVWKAIQQGPAGDLEKKRCMEKLVLIEKTFLVERRYEWANLPTWTENAIHEHGVAPFHAIIAVENASGHDAVVTWADLEEEHPRLTVEIATPSGTLREVLVRQELDGPVEQLGLRFWNLVRAHVPSLKARAAKNIALAAVTYRDRYLSSPIASRLAREVIGGLAGHAGELTGETTISIETAYLNPKMQRGVRTAESEWTRGDHRNTVLEGVLGDLGGAVKLVERKRTDSHHARELVLRWVDGGSWTVRLDHGLSFLRPNGEVPFDFEKPVQEQTEAILGATFSVGNRVGPGAYLYVTDVSG